MSDYFIGLNRGQDKRSLVVGTSTNSTDMELRVTTTAGKKLTKKDAYLFIEILEQYINTARDLPLDLNA